MKYFSKYTTESSGLNVDFLAPERYNSYIIPSLFLRMMSDEKLFQLCKKYGTQARLWRQKFIGLLPEVFRRRLYERKGFSSIFEFAAKLSALSVEQVRLALNLERQFEDKPVLKNLLVNGEVSINKLARVVSIATPQNEEELAARVKLLSKSALEVFVKDEKFAAAQAREQVDQSENKNGLQKPLFEDKSLPGQTLSFELSEDIVKQLNELNAQGHDVNELLRAMLEQRQQQIQQAKNELSENIQPAKSRYIPVKIKTILKQEYGEKCSMPNCQKLAEQIHHTQRFALAHTHDPRYLARLCQEHHQIAHSIDVRFQKFRSAATR